MRNLKKVSALALVLAMALALFLLPSGSYAYATTYSANNPIRVTVNGRWVHFPDQNPIMVENRVLVPVRGAFEEMGFTPYWDANTRMARLTRSDFVIVIPAGSNSFVSNNTIITPEVPQRMVNNRLMLPLRAITDAIGGTAVWDPVHRVAHITTPGIPSPTPTPTPTPGVTPTPTPTPTPTATPRPLLHVAHAFEANPVGFATGGNAYMQGIRHTDSIWGLGADTAPNTSRHNLARNWSTLTASIGRFDGSGSAARSVSFYGDGRNLGTFTVTGDIVTPMNITLDVHNVSILEIRIDAPGTNGVAVVVGRPTLHPSGPGASPTPTPSPTPLPSPVPLLNVAPRTAEYPVGFASGRNADMLGIRYTNTIFGGGWSQHNLANRYTYLTARIGRLDGSGTAERIIRFIGDNNQEIATYRIHGNNFSSTNITVNVRGVHTLRIEIDDPYPNGATAVLANIMVQ